MHVITSWYEVIGYRIYFYNNELGLSLSFECSESESEFSVSSIDLRFINPFHTLLFPSPLTLAEKS